MATEGVIHQREKERKAKDALGRANTNKERAVNALEAAVGQENEASKAFKRAKVHVAAVKEFCSRADDKLIAPQKAMDETSDHQSSKGELAEDPSLWLTKNAQKLATAKQNVDTASKADKDTERIVMEHEHKQEITQIICRRTSRLLRRSRDCGKGCSRYRRGHHRIYRKYRILHPWSRQARYLNRVFLSSGLRYQIKGVGRRRLSCIRICHA
ncbi:hypothetical protein BX600DRAFT_532706 [Xylariales sp. PMI_506]|nr:hypothetical protein BX600DRAFT_532706 [Xylariales sp. PMI_506]